MDIGSLVGATLGGATVGGGLGGFALWMVKRWMDQTDRILRENTNKLRDVEIALAELRGKENVVFRDIRSINDKQVEDRKRIDAAWNILGKLANPRVADIFKEALRQADK